MAVYGVAVYGKSLYGADLGVDYQVQNLTAVQSDFQRITVSWDAPRQADWTSLVLVRSAYGFPVAVTDGVQVVAYPNTGSHTSYDDVDLSPGYWHYTVFASVPFLAWSAATTYSAGDRISYSGAVWICVAPYSTNVTPGTDPTNWLASEETVLWHPAGSVASLAVADHGYGETLDSLVPSAYRSLPGSSTDGGEANSDLAAMLSVLGFGFSQMQAELDDLLNAYDATATRQDRLYAIGATLGLSQEVASSARFQRLRTLRAAALNQEKGTAQGIADVIFAATGLRAEVATGANMMLTQDQSAFVTPLPSMWSAAEPYQLGDQVLYLGVRYTCSGYNFQVTAANYVANSVTGSPNALGTVALGSVTQVKETAAGAASITIPFTVVANFSYVANIVIDAGPDFGVLSATIDGTPVQIGKLVFPPGRLHPNPVVYSNSLDMYAAVFGSYGTVVTFPTALVTGAHTLVLNTATKNASSTGFAIAFATASVSGSPPLYPPGNPPTGASGSAAQWSTTAVSSDTVTYANAVTGGQGTWCPVGVSAALSIGYLGG